MKFINIPNTQLKASAVVLGTDVYGTDVDKETSCSLLDFYIEHGGNVIDTANIYADWVVGERGRSEKLIGGWLAEKKCRHDVIISTKGGHPELSDMSVSRLSREDIVSDIDESLRRLKTDYVDIYWLHRDDVRLPVEGIMDTLSELVKSGKTRYIGMSNWSSERIDEANRYAEKRGISKLVASQIQYSLAKANPEKNDPTLVAMTDNEYDYFKSHDMAVFAFASQAKGFFSKMYKGGENALSPKARDRYLNAETLLRYERLKEVAESYGKTVGETAISALISNKDFVTLPIVGCKNTAQLKDSLSGADLELDMHTVQYIMNRL